MNNVQICMYVFLSLVVVGCFDLESPAQNISATDYRIVAEYPHDHHAFTQGLVYHDGALYESTGLYGQSTVRQVDLVTGDVLRIVSLADSRFGEGLTVWENQLWQLTWKSETGFVYDFNLELVEQFSYSGEGWGLTHDGQYLIQSNGSHVIVFIDPADSSVIRQIEVLDDDRPIDNLNELEYINGEIWANVWLSDKIVRISPESGAVVDWLDLSALARQLGDQGVQLNSDEVLNGIAHQSGQNLILVTGKRWPTLFAIELKE